MYVYKTYVYHIVTSVIEEKNTKISALDKNQSAIHQKHNQATYQRLRCMDTASKVEISKLNISIIVLRLSFDREEGALEMKANREQHESACFNAIPYSPSAVDSEA